MKRLALILLLALVFSGCEEPTRPAWKVTGLVPSSQLAADGEYVFLLKWGSYGTADGQFRYPYGVAVDASGNIYVADSENFRIQKFDSEGSFLNKLGSHGSGDGQLSYPTGVAVDASGNVYVADRGNHRIQKFDADGNFLTKWGSYGTGDGQFSCPSDVAVDASGNVYVADFWNHRIQKFDSNGNFLAKWGSYGSGDGLFSYPFGVAVDAGGNVYVAERANHRMQKLDSNGNFLTKWGSYGSGDGLFDCPVGVGVDASGNVYVAEYESHRIQKFGPATTIMVSIDIKPGSDPNCFNNNGHGVIPVAILGSADFDVTQVDPASVALGGLSVAVRGKSNKLLAHIEDVNGDGFDDLVVQIEDADGTFTSGTGTATLTGNLLPEFGGTPIQGTDDICVVP